MIEELKSTINNLYELIYKVYRNKNLKVEEKNKILNEVKNNLNKNKNFLNVANNILYENNKLLNKEKEENQLINLNQNQNLNQNKNENKNLNKYTVSENKPLHYFNYMDTHDRDSIMLLYLKSTQNISEVNIDQPYDPEELTVKQKDHAIKDFENVLNTYAIYGDISKLRFNEWWINWN